MRRAGSSNRRNVSPGGAIGIDFPEALRARARLPFSRLSLSGPTYRHALDTEGRVHPACDLHATSPVPPSGQNRKSERAKYNLVCHARLAAAGVLYIYIIQKFAVNITVATRLLHDQKTSNSCYMPVEMIQRKAVGFIYTKYRIPDSTSNLMKEHGIPTHEKREIHRFEFLVLNNNNLKPYTTHTRQSHSLVRCFARIFSNTNTLLGQQTTGTAYVSR